MTAADLESALARPNNAELQQIVHDLRTPLSIISMGVEVLKHVRHDDAQFAELTAMIINEGVNPLNAMLDQLGNGRATPKK